jgi:hypothetical protein
LIQSIVLDSDALLARTILCVITVADIGRNLPAAL